MKMSLPLWLRRNGPRSFRHGIHPDPHKEATGGLAVEHMPLVERYVLPLSQHAGAPSVPRVRPGQEVRRGECLADPDGQRSVALHAPASGRVRAIELSPHPSGGLSPAIILETNFYADQSVQCAPAYPGEPGTRELWNRRASDPPTTEEERAAALRQVQRAGVVGMGGAAYPAHAKLRLPPGKRVDTVVLNGAECEPYLTADHRLMVERSAAVILGLRLLVALLGARRGSIGVEVNKPDAIEALSRACRGDDRLEVVPLGVEYPEGAKQMLIEAVTGARVPLGGRSVDIHVTIHNVASAAAIYDACASGRPAVERIVTVTGAGVRRPANVLVPIGTPMNDLVAHCGGLTEGTRSVVVGGAMMGQTQASLAVPVTKAVSGLLALTEGARPIAEEPCIRCGSCLEACPMFLNPAQLALLTRGGRSEALREANVGACFECGSCAFVCPSHIPLTDLIRTGKSLARKVAS